ncbi:MAG: hypothetical protein IPL53_08550 [Ignavibacteria bacterium]|nr:hypothetical protein [Ignavibacteria bacterium]
MIRNKFLQIVTLVYLTSSLLTGCSIDEPSAPSWDVGLNLPFTNKTYNIFDIIKRSSNVGFDSTNNDLVFLYGETNYKRSFGEDIKFDGINTTEVTYPSALRLDTFIVVDDSSFVNRMEFLNGVLNFTFFNKTGESFTVNAALRNLFRVSDNDTARLTGTVTPGESKSIDLSLSEYYIKNETPDNSLKLRLEFTAPDPVPVRFNYTLSSYSIKNITGRLKPLSTGITNDEVLDPFGSDVPEGEIDFASVSPNKNFFVTKKFSNIYQVDFTHLSIVGINKNGHRVRLKYLRNGRPGDPIDSVFSLTLPSDRDSTSFPINEDNSNILEFINNIPKKIEVTRNDFLNLSYKEGMVNASDSISLKLIIQVPLDISISEPIVFSDTVDAGIDDEDQRRNLDDAKNLLFTFRSVNGFPLKGTAKILLLDSFFTPLLAISRIVGNETDSSVSVNATPVGADGYVISSTTTTFESELDSNHIKLLKHVGKVIYEYKLYTDPDNIPPPLTTVKIRGTDIVRALSFGKVTYRINSGN